MGDTDALPGTSPSCSQRLPSSQHFPHSDPAVFNSAKQVSGMPRKFAAGRLSFLSPAGCEARLSWAIWTLFKVAELIRPLGYFSAKQPAHWRSSWGSTAHTCLLLRAPAPQPASEPHPLEEGLVSVCAPAVLQRRAATAGSQNSPQGQTSTEHLLHVGLMVGWAREPLLCKHSLTAHNSLWVTVPHVPFHWIYVTA